MSGPQRDLLTLWDVVQRKLHDCLRATTFPSWPSESLSWPKLPTILAEGGLFLSGLPDICKPDVRDDVVQDDLISWTSEQLLALERALDQGVMKVVPREPLSRRIIMGVVSSNGYQDSTLGFSDQWIFDHMFPERLYEGFTVTALRTTNINSFSAILKNANIIHNGVPWIVLPSKLWSSGQYLSGMPRVCLPKVVDDAVPKDDPSLSMKWRKDQRVALQRAADSGLLKVLPRPADRDVIFEVLEPDGLLRDDDCGFSAHWKMRQTAAAAVAAPETKIKPQHRNKSQSSPSSAPPIPSPFPWAVSRPGPLSKKQIVAERYMALLRIHGLLLESPEGPAWVYVPQMLATRRCFILGLPRDCLPIVRDDDVVANYDPKQWSTSAQDSFLQALEGGKLLVINNTNRIRILYRVVDALGNTRDETISFSERWLRENMDPVDLADPAVTPAEFVRELWLCMLESVNIPCHDHRGRRRIPWLQLPLFLGNRRGYVAGCPAECHPRVEDDIVSEMSSPYFWDDYQIRLMAEAFIKNRVSIVSRHPKRDVLFTYVKGGMIFDSTCGFSPGWLQLNLHAIPDSMANLPFIKGQDPSPPPSTPIAPKLPPEPTSTASSPPRGQKVTVKRYAKRPRDLISLLPGYAPLVNGANLMEPKKPEVASQSASLKIIIPAYKRRDLLAQKQALAASQGSTSQASSSLPNGSDISNGMVTGIRTRNPRPIPALPRHMLRSSQRISNGSSPRHPQPQSFDSSGTSEDDRPGTFGLRSSMSPPLPPSRTLPDPLPPVPIPAFLPVPGGNLTWDNKRHAWELIISEQWTPQEWKNKLPVFPARVLWNAIQKVWMCEPSTSLTRPQIRLSPEVQAALESSTIDKPAPPVEAGLSIIWHRWRRSWGLFEYISPIPP